MRRKRPLAGEDSVPRSVCGVDPAAGGGRKCGAEVCSAHARAAAEKTRVLEVQAHPRWRTRDERRIG